MPGVFRQKEDVMNTAQKLACTDDHAVCGVCRRRAFGLGYAPKRSTNIMWLCDSADCHHAAAKVYTMPQPTLDKHETLAADMGGQWAGEYLDELGVTDLTKLSPDEWREFLRRVVVGFSDALRNGFKPEEIPF
jgi:hypothetical protein